MEASNNGIITAENGKGKQLKNKQGKKKRPNALKSALLFFLGIRKTTKYVQAEADWSMLVGCIRPMSIEDKNVQSTLMMLPDAAPENDGKMKVKKLDKVEEDVTKLLPPSDASLSSSSSSSVCESSRYASALNLQDLDKGGSSDDNEDDVFDDTEGDAMIDMKAEMFIAQFYAQMRTQSIHSSSSS